LGSESDIRALGFGGSGLLIGAGRGHSSPIPDSAPSASLRDRCRIGSGWDFAVGCAVGGVSHAAAVGGARAAGR